MKLVSWNVNGLRACIQKGFLDEFEKFNADFFCLQETKLSEGQLELDLPGYHQYWCYADKKGYSGTAVFARHKPLSVQFGIGVEELDHEGRVITLEYQEFFLVTCYTPNAQRELARIDHRMAWDEAFRTFLQGLDAQKPVILCGDLNVAHKEIDLKNPASNRGNAGFSDQERESFQKTLDLGFTDTFRHLHPDKTGAYSWWSYMFKAREKNAGWRIDYFLISDRIRDQLYRAEIHSDILGSDHCPVSIDMDLLVNGALYTHETAGKPRVVEIENPKKNAKSSAVTAKGFASILPIVLLLCAAISIVTGYIRDSALFPTESQPLDMPLQFEIEVYRDPFTPVKMDGSVHIYAQNQTQPDGTILYGCFDENGNSFYIPEELPSGNHDIFVRITGKDPNLDYYSDLWNIQLNKNTDDQNTMLPPLTADDLLTIPYYNADHLDVPAGWLLWADLSQPVISDFTLSVTHPLSTTGFESDLTLIPFLSRTDLTLIDAKALLEYIANDPEVTDVLYSLYNIPYDVTPQQFTDLVNQYAPLKEFLSRYDCIMQLMNVNTDNNNFINNILLSISSVRDLMSVTEEMRYLTAAYSTCNWSYDFTTSGADPEKIVIEYVLEDILDSPSHALTRCRHEGNIPLIYEFLREKIPALRALEKRDNAVQVLMDTSFFKGRDHFQFGPISKLPSILLSLPVYQEKMTPYQQALYITGAYPTSPKQPNKLIVFNNLQELSTNAIYARLLNSKSNATMQYLNSAPSSETLYHIYLIECQTNPYLQEFFQREDAVTVLIEKNDFAFLYQYYAIKDQIGFLSDQQLVDRLLKDESLLCEFLTSNLSHYAKFIRQEISSRPGAIDILMNMEPFTDTKMQSFLHTFLSQIQSSMTPRQKAQYICNAYNSCNEDPLRGPSVAEKNLHNWTTARLFNALLTQKEVLVKALESTSELEVRVEIYRILSQSSNLLQELEKRPAETYEQITKDFNNGGQLFVLRAVWSHLFMPTYG